MSVYLKAAERFENGDRKSLYAMSNSKFDAMNEAIHVDNPDTWYCTKTDIAVLVLLFCHAMHKTGDL
jgi:hypothetical protein